jgi:predicted N-acetyltransferase YhbS
MIEVRACTPEHAPAVGALLEQLGYPVSARQAAEQIRELGGTASDPILIAETDGKIVGLLASHLCRMLQYRRPVMRITVLVVDHNARRRGVGKRLMEHAEQIATAAGCELVELTSAMDRADAHAFYSGLGYEANSLRFRKLLVGGDGRGHPDNVNIAE